MSTEQTIDTTVTDDLDLFSSELFGESSKTSDDAKSEEVAPEEADSVAPIDTQTPAEEDGAPEDTKSEENPDATDEDNAEVKPKNRLQERIDELTAARRQAERERDEALRKLQETTQPKPEPTKVEAKPVPEGPKPDDKNEDGTDKYPLGEFDPKYNAELVKYTVQKTLDEERTARETQEQEKAKQTVEEQYRSTLTANWNEKLDVVQERYPDYQEKGEAMLEVFEGIDPAYGQYLTDTLMEMDAGPEVFYYLANNVEEAKEIVNAGPRKATIAMAKLEAQLAGSKTNAPAVKVTNAPTPPPQVKGSAVSKSAISPDTDDLDAFSRVLFTKKK